MDLSKFSPEAAKRIRERRSAAGRAMNKRMKAGRAPGKVIQFEKDPFGGRSVLDELRKAWGIPKKQA